MANNQNGLGALLGLVGALNNQGGSPGSAGPGSAGPRGPGDRGPCGRLLCHSWQGSQTCKFGDSCRFAHYSNGVLQNVNRPGNAPGGGMQGNSPGQGTPGPMIVDTQSAPKKVFGNVRLEDKVEALPLLARLKATVKDGVFDMWGLGIKGIQLLIVVGVLCIQRLLDVNPQGFHTWAPGAIPAAHEDLVNILFFDNTCPQLDESRCPV